MMRKTKSRRKIQVTLIGVSISHLAFCTRSVFRRETDPACARHRWREDTAGGSSTSCAACKARPHQEEPCLACTEGRDQSGPISVKLREERMSLGKSREEDKEMLM